MHINDTCCPICSSTDIYRGLNDAVCNSCHPTGAVPAPQATPTNSNEQVFIKGTGSYQWPAGKYIVSVKQSKTSLPRIFRFTLGGDELRSHGPNMYRSGQEMYATPVTASLSAAWNKVYRHPKGDALMGVGDLCQEDGKFIPPQWR